VRYVPRAEAPPVLVLLAWVARAIEKKGPWHARSNFPWDDEGQRESVKNG